MSNTKALDIVNLHAGYGETEILKGINLSVEHSEIVAIIGPNGAGKSTVVKSVLGLLNIISGNISLNGNNIVGIAPDKAIKSGISYVPQTHNIFPNLTITENLEMGAWTKSKGIPERIQEMFDLFPDLKVKRNKVAGSLSGGQRQMVAMAKALMVDSKIMLLDEPTAGLSPKFQSEIFRTIKRINKNGVPILLVEQNAKQALETADRGYVLVDGSNKVEGKGQDLINDRNVARMFLGSKD
ncbi:MAG: ABC transporter ATP-binding protein [Paracoccaceae bacterium]|nr:ABC transporter ATP-binding protein [Paracoccaceae bacterium]